MFQLKFIYQSLCGQEHNLLFCQETSPKGCTWFGNKENKFQKGKNHFSPILGLTPSLGFSESLESLSMVLSSMIAGCSLWPLWLEVSLHARRYRGVWCFVVAAHEVSLISHAVSPRTELDTWRQMLFFQCHYPSSCPGFHICPLQSNRTAALRHFVRLKGMRCLEWLGKHLKALMQGRRNFPNPQHHPCNVALPEEC